MKDLKISFIYIIGGLSFIYLIYSFINLCYQTEIQLVITLFAWSFISYSFYYYIKNDSWSEFQKWWITLITIASSLIIFFLVFIGYAFTKCWHF